MSTQGFGIWITGVPSSGKSTITRELVILLHDRGVRPVVLESDVLRAVLTPAATYSPEERDLFYRQMAGLGAIISRAGVPVIFDATANRRKYRNLGRSAFPQFLEVLVHCPAADCRERDPKGIYAAASAGIASNVPGLHAEYEPPFAPELSLDGRRDPRRNAEKIVDLLLQRSYI